MAGKTPMSPSSAARIQSTQAKGGNPTGKASFSARAQSAGATNNNKGVLGGGAAKTTGGAGAGVGGGVPKAPAGGKAPKK